ncbi:Mor transcription activator family protein [Candidatus Magnetaquicoccus inordinatus]|uniref:Mor transcription activator family protein n=1 Tax=Candidatus Magnetaquicoccus inordinatus TaxID=2496818 RepID=UPI001D0F25A5|nr:Mor transcription activator family protein [Candidatus Magnetaquicoccus inordinatus]
MSPPMTLPVHGGVLHQESLSAEGVRKPEKGKIDRLGELIKEDLTQSMRDLADIIGLPDTRKIVRKYHGTRIFIPRTPRVQHHLATLLGMAQAWLLSEHFGGETISVPRMANLLRVQRNRDIVRRYDSGEAVRHLAHEYQLTDRQIYAILTRWGCM